VLFRSVIAPYVVVNMAAPGVDSQRWRMPEDLREQVRFLVDETGLRTRPEAALAGPFEEAAPR